MNECKCTMRTRLVGDGCEICNPEFARDIERDIERDNFEEDAAPYGFDLTRRTCAEQHRDGRLAALEALAIVETENKRLRDIIDEIHAWAVCSCIATPEDMMQNMPRVVEITRPNVEVQGREAASPRSVPLERPVGREEN